MEGVLSEGKISMHVGEVDSQTSNSLFKNKSSSAGKCSGSYENSLTDENLSSKKYSVVTTNLDLANDTVRGTTNLSIQQVLSTIKYVKSVEGSVCSIPSVSVTKTQVTTPINSATSELFSSKNPILTKSSKVLSFKSGQSKSEITSEHRGFVQRHKTFTNKTSSENFGFDSHKHEQGKGFSTPKNFDINNSQYSKLYVGPGKDSPFHKSQYTDGHETKEPDFKYNLSKSHSSCNRTVSSTTTRETKADFNPQCIPPWAKNLRKLHGMTCSDEDVPQTSLQEKIKNLMNKHSRLMLVKRGESRKQLTLKPSEYGGIGTVKIASKNTRYYMTPVPKEFTENCIGKEPKYSIPEPNIQNLESTEMAATNKISRHQEKTEVSHVLKSLYNSKRCSREMDKEDNKVHQKHTNCLKITPSKIRNYVTSQTLNNNERKLHEIIQIRKVPSQGFPVGRKPSSKYVINLPQCNQDGGTTINKITVKEKCKLRINSVEDLNENITEINFNKHYSEAKGNVENYYEAENFAHDFVPYSKKTKLPTKSKTLNVTATSTPEKHLLKKQERGKDKILLIQYEMKSKPENERSEVEKPTSISTKLLGIRQPWKENVKEMYLYGTKTDGNTCKEKITKVGETSPKITEKVDLLFQELKEMTFQPSIEIESPQDPQPSVNSKIVQYPSTIVETGAVSVQAFPEVRSTEVQVHDSILFHQKHSIVDKSIISLEDEKEQLSSKEDKAEYTRPMSKRSSEMRQKESFPSDLSQPAGSVSKPQTGVIKEGQEDVPVEIETVISTLDEKEEFKDSMQFVQEIEISDNKSIKITEDEDTNNKEEYYGSESKSFLENNEESKSQLDNEDKQQLIDKLSEDTDENLTEDNDENLIEDNDVVLANEEAFVKGERGPSITEGRMEDDVQLYDNRENGGFGGNKEEEMEGGDKVGKECTEEEDGTPEEGEGIKDEIYDTGDQHKAWNGKELTEDIRSYDFDPAQDFELRMISSSKFFHQKDSLRKLNWTEDILYLEKNVCPKLVRGLAEIAVKQPRDPISYLAHWIYKDYHSSEHDEQNSVFKEHLEVAKGMTYSKSNDKLVCRKFNIQRYPNMNIVVEQDMN